MKTCLGEPLHKERVLRVVNELKTAVALLPHMVVKPLNPLSDQKISLGPSAATFCRRSSSGCAAPEGRNSEKCWGLCRPEDRIAQVPCQTLEKNSSKAKLEELQTPKFLVT